MSTFPAYIRVLFFEHHPVIHERIIPLTGIFSIDGLFDERDNFSIFYAIFFAEKEIDEHGPDICFD